jgi:hypothetical protein
VTKKNEVLDCVIGTKIGTASFPSPSGQKSLLKDNLLGYFALLCVMQQDKIFVNIVRKPFCWPVDSHWLLLGKQFLELIQWVNVAC